MAETTAKFEAGNNYIINPAITHRVGVLVGNTGITADANGRKIIPNGTPIGGAVNALQTRDTVLGVVADNTVQGLLWEPEGLDVTDGAKGTTMFIRGVADTKQLPATVTETIKTALPLVTFQGGR